jgi:hypothetical protein
MHLVLGVVGVYRNLHEVVTGSMYELHTSMLPRVLVGKFLWHHLCGFASIVSGLAAAHLDMISPASASAMLCRLSMHATSSSRQTENTARLRACRVESNRVSAGGLRTIVLETTVYPELSLHVACIRDFGKYLEPVTGFTKGGR